MPDATDFLFAPTPNDEAIAFLKDKPVVSRTVFKGLLPELKARAFTIAGIEPANVLQSVRDRIADLPAGADWDAVKSDIANEISPYLVDPDATGEDHDDQVAAANRKAELLLRVHGFQAYQSGAVQVQDRQRDALPFYQYLTMEDEKVRASHAALDKIVLPADHEFWKTHTPPWDWGCRCQRVALSQEDRDDLAEKEKDKPADERRVLSPALQDELTKTRRLPIGNGAVINVASAYEKGEPGAFYWNAGDLRIPLEELKARYDQPTWAAFEAWAKRTPLEAGADRNVWTWLEGKPAAPAVPVPPPLKDRTAGPRKLTASQLLALKTKKGAEWRSALTMYTGTSYGAINSSPESAAAKMCLEAIGQLQPYKQKEPLYRGLAFGNRFEYQRFIKSFAPIQKTARTFTSFSPQEEIANKVGLAYGRYGVKIELVTSASGTDIHELSDIPEEKEVVFPIGTRFRLLGEPVTEKVGNKTLTRIRIEEI